METLGAMAPGAMGPWRHGSMGVMGVEGHGGRVERGRAEQAERAERAGMHWGPLKSFDWVWRHRVRGPWGHGARSHKVGGWPWKHGDIGGHGARSHGAMEA